MGLSVNKHTNAASQQNRPTKLYQIDQKFALKNNRPIHRKF